MHDVTPDEWHYGTFLVSITEAFAPEQERTYNAYEGFIDITAACGADLDKVHTGQHEVIIMVVKGETTQLQNVKDCITDNHMYKTTINLNCEDGKYFTDIITVIV